MSALHASRLREDRAKCKLTEPQRVALGAYGRGEPYPVAPSSGYWVAVSTLLNLHRRGLIEPIPSVAGEATRPLHLDYRITEAGRSALLGR